jgi:hypothetical protein
MRTFVAHKLVMIVADSMEVRWVSAGRESLLLPVLAVCA